MTSTGETAVHSTRAAVYNYDAGQWKSVDGGSSRVYIFHNPANNNYRVIGQSVATEAYILNTPIFKGLLYQKVSEMFLQWTDHTTIFGLSFASEEEANAFTDNMTNAINHLKRLADGVGTPAERPLSMHTQPSTPAIGRDSSTGSFRSASMRLAASPGPDDRRRSQMMTAHLSGSTVDLDAEAAQPTQPGVKNLVALPDNQLTDRERVVKEVFTSERSYLHQITNLVEKCLKPIETSSKPFNENEKKVIFNNIKVIQTLNLRFFQELKPRIENWHESQRIGDVFKNMIPYFKVYKEYYNNYDSALACLESIKKRKEVEKYLKSLEAFTDGHQLPHLLVQPVQRIPRYTMLLNEILKKTPDMHPDYAGIQESYDKIKDFTSTVNESVRETELTRKFGQMVKDTKKYEGFHVLIAPHRQLLYENECKIHTGFKEYNWILVFNDVVVLATAPNKKASARVEQVVNNEHLWVVDMDAEHLNLLSPSDIVSIIITKDEKVKLLTTTQRAIDAWVRSKNINEANDVRRFRFQFETGVVYEGQWDTAKPCGTGTFELPNGAKYVGEVSKGKFEGQGKITYRNGDVYEGSFKNDLAEGQGTMTSGVGEYKGAFVAGQRTGQGTMRWSNGDEYEGEWNMDRMEGAGKWTSPYGTSYEGEWKADMFHGKGRLQNAQGVYDGCWSAEAKDGQGRMEYADGSVYEGNWREGHWHGAGKFVGRDGKVTYEGEFAKSRYTGKGVLACEGLYTYDGMFKDDKKWGAGVMTWHDGSTYTGDWVEDRREGEGKFVSAAGESFEGTWQRDRIRKGTYLYADGSKYVGDFLNERRHGKGEMTWPDGSSFTGDWAEGRRHGEGHLAGPSGAYSYDGEWVDNCREGRGTYSDKSGQYAGMWERDKRSGMGTYKDVVNKTIYHGAWKGDIRHGEGKLMLISGDQTNVEIALRYVNGKLEKGSRGDCVSLPVPRSVLNF